MKILVTILALSYSLFASDIIIKESACGMDETTQKLKNIISSSGLHIFAIINHSGNTAMEKFTTKAGQCKKD